MRYLPFLPAFLLLSFAAPAHADPYQDCVALIAEDADAAYDRSLGWREEGGGAAALHCGALALMELELYDAAAGRLEDLAARKDAGSTEARVAILDQAASAWLKHGDLKRAAAVYGAALDLQPGNAQLLTARGRTYLMAGETPSALEDFNLALAAAPQNAEALLLRARAERLLFRLDEAARDIAAAEKAGADSLLLHLERGLIRKAQGNKDGARADWLYVQANADEASPEAEAARNYMAQMDVSGAE